MVPFPATAALDVATVADGLAVARVLEPARVRAAQAEYATAYAGGDGEGFAEYLTSKGLLTEYQARTAVAGDADRLAVGPYLLLEPLGDNNLGTMYRAVHATSGGRYAVRVMPLRSLWKSREAKRHVARLAALPPHPALVPLADVDTAGGCHYLAWPFADGEPLSRAVARDPLAPDVAARLFADLADGLVACHAAGVVHGLLRPSAILIGGDRKPRLLDLGLGDILADTDDDSMFDTMSTSHAAVERMDFTPPETVADPTVRSPEADAYSLGAVLYLAVTGEPPFPDGSVVDKMIAHQTRDPLPVRMRNPHVPPPLGELILRLLAKNPADRPSLATVRDDLRALADAVRESSPLSVTASTLRDAMELSKTFELRKRSLPERDSEGTIDFDLPVSRTPSPDPVPVASPTPKPARKPDPSPLPVAPPRMIVLPTAVVPPPALPPAKKVSAALRVTAELRRPVGWEPGSWTPGLELPTARPPVVVPPPPRRTAIGGLVRGMAFWRSVADDVQLSVFGPPEIAPGEKVKFIAYAHLPDVSDNVVTLCRAMHKATELIGAGHTSEPVPRGTEVALHLALASAGVAKSLVTFPWTGQPQPKTFDVFVPWESPPGLAAGTLTAGIGEVLTATVPVHFVVLPRGR